MMASNIQWTNETWNPIIGCSKVSAGCANCYAEKMAFRQMMMGNENYEKVVHRIGVASWNHKTVFVESALEKPLHWKKPRMIFVCSMGDLFHESVPFEWVDKVFAVMAMCPQHTFQILTKRPERMREYFKAKDLFVSGKSRVYEQFRLIRPPGQKYNCWAEIEWSSLNVLSNVWLGVTAENQAMADERIPILLEIPAAKRFVSVEPMLEAVDLNRLKCGYIEHPTNGSHKPVYDDALFSCAGHNGLDWVIVGAESGAKRRECKQEWVNSVWDQCKDAGVPCFVKQVHGDNKTLIKMPVGFPQAFPV